MAAVHTWDMHGAAGAALTAAWASCLGGRLPPTFDPPHVPGRDLVEVIEDLAALTD
jgi:2-haloacid dehalogenase